MMATAAAVAGVVVADAVVGCPSTQVLFEVACCLWCSFILWQN
jgi:hypothetical protein